MAEREARFFSGTSNIVVPLRQSEYPPDMQGRSRLTYYASLFSSLEVNSSFYKVPKPSTVQRWCTEVPDGFRFTFKVPKLLTHAKGLQFSSVDVSLFANAIAGVDAHKGCLLVQLPPSCKRDREEELNALLENLAEEIPGWPIAVEFRDNSWYSNGVYRTLKQYGACLVQQDLPASATPLISVSDHFSYLRYHGPEGGYRGSYSDDFLQAQTSRIAGLLAEGREVYVYFNNTAGAALPNLQTLNRMLGQYSTSSG